MGGIRYERFGGALQAVLLALILCSAGCGGGSKLRVERELAVPGGPYGVAAASNGRVFLSTVDPGGVLVLEPPTVEPLSALELAGTPAAIALTRSERGLLVVQAGIKRVALLALEGTMEGGRPQVAASWPVASVPLNAVMSPDGERAWVSHEGAAGVSLLDFSSPGALAGEIALGGPTLGLAMGPGRAYVTGRNPETEQGVLWVLDSLAAATGGPLDKVVLARVVVGPEPRRVVTLPQLELVLVFERGEGSLAIFDKTKLEAAGEDPLLGRLPLDPGAADMAVAAARGWVFISRSEPASLEAMELGRDGDQIWQSEVGRLELTTPATGMAVGAWEKRLYLTHTESDALTVVKLD